MAKQNGELRTCDRCGKTQFFKCTGEKERDGGYTRWNTFEDAVGWDYKREIGDMCPECSEEYNNRYEKFLSEFKNNN